MAGPLSGVRVADFTWVWAGPFCTMQFAHMGAEVIRVESVRRVCATRMLPPWLDGQIGPNRSGYFNQYNQGKRSITLDLTQSEGKEIAKKLVTISDVAAENFAGGVIDRLGLGYDELRKAKPDIIMISMSGYGQTGPDSGFVSYGPSQVPLSGLSSLTGYAGWQPMHVGLSYGDPNAGLHAAFALLAALLYRERTGKGQYIDMSQWESTMNVLAEGIMDYTMNRSQPPRSGNRDPLMAPHGIFRCAPAQGELPPGTLAEDQWVSIACGSDDEWRALCGVMGKGELADDARFRTLDDRKANEDALEAIVEEWTLTLEPSAVTDRLQKAGVAAFPPMANYMLYADPHLEARGYWVERSTWRWACAGTPASPGACRRRRARCGGQRRGSAKTTNMSSESCWACPASRSRTWWSARSFTSTARAGSPSPLATYALRLGLQP
jgi:crotonobetainyl-CoA:carnitine CoA-transferase CaiB-like acyl-CoA transferase